MDIFHYHPDTGIYLGQGKADESPLEPGVWLIPAHAAVEPPPAIAETERAVWDGMSWNIELIPVPEPEPTPEPPPVLTTEQKLEAAGLTVAELKELFGLP